MPLTQLLTQEMLVSKKTLNDEYLRTKLLYQLKATLIPVKFTLPKLRNATTLSVTLSSSLLLLTLRVKLKELDR